MSKLLDRMKLASDLNKAIFLLLVFFFAFLITGIDRVGHWTELFIGCVVMALRSEFKARQSETSGPAERKEIS